MMLSIQLLSCHSCCVLHVCGTVVSVCVIGGLLQHLSVLLLLLRVVVTLCITELTRS